MEQPKPNKELVPGRPPEIAEGNKNEQVVPPLSPESPKPTPLAPPVPSEVLPATKEPLGKNVSTVESHPPVSPTLPSQSQESIFRGRRIPNDASAAERAQELEKILRKAQEEAQER